MNTTYYYYFMNLREIVRGSIFAIFSRFFHTISNVSSIYIYRVTQKNDNTLHFRILQKLSKLRFSYMVHIMTETFNTFVKNFYFVRKKTKGTPLLSKLVARKCSAENDYNAIDIFKLIKQVIDVDSAFIANCWQPFFQYKIAFPTLCYGISRHFGLIASFSFSSSKTVVLRL